MDVQQIARAFQYSGLQAFGLTMPRLAADWSPSGASNPSFTVVDGAGSPSSGKPLMTITSSANWAAPFEAAYVDLVAGQPIPVTLVMSDGSAETAPGALLTVPDQQWLRLGRLYCEILQGSETARPERDRGLSCRPVPRYVFFPGQSISATGSPTVATSGLAEAGADLGFAGDARFYDGDGLLIDPIAVMSAFSAILTRYPGLQATDFGAQPVSPVPLGTYLTGGSSPLASNQVTRIRLVEASGAPYKPKTLHLTGLNAVNTDAALYELSGSPASIGLDPVDATDFPQYDHDRIVFGSACNGRLAGSFEPPAPPHGSPSVSLARDYYTIRVVELQSYLNGDWSASSPADAAMVVQRQAPVRINESISLLLDGNDVLGAIHVALDAGSPPGSTIGSPPESDLTLVVAQAVDRDFPIPPAAGLAAHWPHFPPGIAVDANATLSPGLKNQLTLTAGWVTTTPNTPLTGDVDLEIANLPASAWVRVYPRKFQPNATATRGDGQGREVSAGGIVVMTLTDPLSLRDPLTGLSYLPKSATLQFDLAVVLPNGNARIYGGLTVSIGASPISSPPFSPHLGSNPCAFASFQGVSNAGILGLGRVGPISPTPSTLLGWVEALSGEGTPRDAPRLPTMARRELLVAGAGTDASSGSPAFARTWSGVIAGGRIQPETVCASSRIGAPGSFGGRETSVTGAATHQGLLAYDVARHALRRSQEIVPRLVTLASSSWNSPVELRPFEPGGSPAGTGGTMAGAMLQTVAPYCESPELYGLWVIPGVSSAVTQWITNNVSNSSTIIQALQTLENAVAPPRPVVESEPGTGPLGQFDASVQRLAIELERELTSVLYGRRDAQWALQSALQTARHFIYIETPGFCSTAHAPGSPTPDLPNYAVDLIATLKDQLQNMPGLRVVVCVNRNPDFAPGYEGMASYEVQDRLTIVQGMPGAGSSPPSSPPSSSQFALFHPIGFPGRPARVETNVVIIDDIWAMVGGCTFRRRGLTFDGSSDLAFTDTQLENGRSVAIRDFRRALMAARLGIAADSTQSSYVALNESATAFALIQDALSGGGLGKIAPVWDGSTPGLTRAMALPADEANPDGRNFDELTASLVAVLGSASGL